ncbi:MAG: FHA domain-containing protein, partial [Deltaproteobacteria bacterium]|nr:FHA domain-containing protein [Deltaproteobacteria bacterium]
MAKSPKNLSEEQTLIKPFEDIEASKSHLRSSESFPLVEIVHGPRQGAWFTVAYQKESTLGRAATNSIILEDNSVSRSHSVIIQRGEDYFIRDIGSRNGTFVNGQKIGDEQDIHHLDVIKIGIYTLRFLTEPTDAPFEFPDEHTPRLPAEDEVATKVELPSEEKPKESPAEEVSQESATMVEPEPQLESHLSQEAPSEIPPEDSTSDGQELALAEGGASALSQELALALEEGSPKAAKKGKGFLFLVSGLVLLLIVGVGLWWAYSKGYLTSSSSGQGGTAGSEETPEVNSDQVLGLPEGGGDQSQDLVLFLEVDSQPLPAQVYLGEESLGQTPFSLSRRLEPGVNKLKATYQLTGVGETLDYEQSFNVEEGEESLKVTLTPPIGELKITAFPQPGELQLQANYEGKEDEPAKSLTVGEINYHEPLALPYGRYVAEVRVPQKLSGSQAEVSVIRFRREFTLGEEQKSYSLSVTQEDLNRFPAKIESKPSGAELYV